MPSKLPKGEAAVSKQLEKPRHIHALILIGVVTFVLGLSAIFLTKGNFLLEFLERRSGGQEEQVVPENVAAIVNGVEIPKEEYARRLAQNIYYFENVYPETTGSQVEQYVLDDQPRIVIEGLILDELFSQYLKSAGEEISQDVALAKLKEEIVNVEFSGDLEAYEAELLEKYQKNIDDVILSTRRDLMITKVNELEEIDPSDFDSWYAEIKSEASILVNPDIENLFIKV